MDDRSREEGFRQSGRPGPAFGGECEDCWAVIRRSVGIGPNLFGCNGAIEGNLVENQSLAKASEEGRFERPVVIPHVAADARGVIPRGCGQ